MAVAAKIATGGDGAQKSGLPIHRQIRCRMDGVATAAGDIMSPVVAWAGSRFMAAQTDIVGLDQKVGAITVCRVAVATGLCGPFSHLIHYQCLLVAKGAQARLAALLIPGHQ
jgi:hypothetical protein